MKPIILASASPRRKELLQSAGIDCEVRPASVSEDVKSWDDIDAAVIEIALRKADALAGEFGDRFVLAADTIVVGQDSSGKQVVLGKPSDKQHAKQMLEMLQGKTHEVVSVIALVNANENIRETQVVKTKVTFAPMSDGDIDEYIATGEVNDKAGAYAVQGIGARYVKSIEGSYTSVVGLPLVETIALLKKYQAI